MQAPPLSGFARAPFAAARDAFAENFRAGAELGAAFAVFVEGECVVDLRGGYVDRGKETLWTEESLACIFSAGKAVIALLMARAASAGLVDYEAPVARYWPEFATAGKEKVTVAEALSHQAGLCGFPDEMPPETWLDRDAIASRIARMAPLWPPGSASGYHPQTIGFIAEEVFRGATGRSLAVALREDFSDPHGLSLYCGMREQEMARAAFMQKPPRAPDLGPLTPLKEYAFLKPWSAPARVAVEAWMATALPASNMHADARSLAEIVHPFADHGRFRGETIVSAEASKAALAERIRGDDLVLPFHLSWAAGVMRNEHGHFGPSQTAFGHGGSGGACVLFDPAHGLSAAYLMNKMSPHLLADPRALRLIDAVYAAL